MNLSTEELIEKRHMLSEEKKKIKHKIRKYERRLAKYKDLKENLNKQIKNLNLVHIDIGKFPEEIKVLKIYIPYKFKIYKKTEPLSEIYFVEYDKYLFSMEDHANKPFIFRINGERIKSSVFIQIYFKYPDKVKILGDKYFDGEMNSLAEIIVMTKKVLNIWNSELSFGIILFHYWYLIFNQFFMNTEVDYTIKYKSLYKMFQSDVVN